MLAVDSPRILTLAGIMLIAVVGLLHLKRADKSPAVRQTHALLEPDKSINRPQIFRSLISSLKPGKMLDLGAGHGNFSLAAARLDWGVTAVDGRTVRMPDPEKDPDRAKLIRSVR